MPARNALEDSFSQPAVVVESSLTLCFTCHGLVGHWLFDIGAVNTSQLLTASWETALGTLLSNCLQTCAELRTSMCADVC
jgi:hypothetical protein